VTLLIIADGLQWWADPVAALALAPFFLKEGREGVFRHEE
jgi:hypothetical protein